MSPETALYYNSLLDELSKHKEGQLYKDYPGIYPKVCIINIEKARYIDRITDEQNNLIGFRINDKGLKYLKKGGYLNEVSFKEKRAHKRRNREQKIDHNKESAKWSKRNVIVGILAIATMIAIYLLTRG